MSRTEQIDWSDAELEILNAHYEKLGSLKLAKMLPPRTADGVRRKANRLGLKAPRRYPLKGDWTDSEDTAIRVHYPDIGAAELAKMLAPRSKDDVSKRATYLGVVKERVYPTTWEPWSAKEMKVLAGFQRGKTIDDLYNLLPSRSKRAIKSKLQDHGQVLRTQKRKLRYPYPFPELPSAEAPFSKRFHTKRLEIICHRVSTWLDDVVALYGGVVFIDPRMSPADGYILKSIASSETRLILKYAKYEKVIDLEYGDTVSMWGKHVLLFNHEGQPGALWLERRGWKPGDFDAWWPQI